MSRIKIGSVLHLLLWIVCFAGSSSANDWWPMVDGAEYVYVNAAEDTMVVSCEKVDSITYMLTYETATCSMSVKIYASGEDVYQKGNSALCDDAGGGWYSYESVTLLNGEPMFGRQWVEVRYMYAPGATYEMSVLISVGDALEQVEVPAGVFDAVDIRTRAFTVDTFWGGTYSLAEGIGPVVIEPGGWKLVDYPGLVNGEEQSMSDLRRAFR